MRFFAGTPTPCSPNRERFETYVAESVRLIPGREPEHSCWHSCHADAGATQSVHAAFRTEFRKMPNVFVIASRARSRDRGAFSRASAQLAARIGVFEPGIWLPVEFSAKLRFFRSPECDFNAVFDVFKSDSGFARKLVCCLLCAK